jgi:hypothetical protein
LEVKRDQVCPKCNATDIIPGVRVLDYLNALAPQSLQVEVPENPDALFFKGKQRGSLHAWICGSCGFAELFVSNPGDLLAAYRKNPNREDSALDFD